MRCCQTNWGAATSVGQHHLEQLHWGAAHEVDSCRASSSSAVAAAASGLTSGLSRPDRRRTDGVSDGCTPRSGSGFSGCICPSTSRPPVLAGIIRGPTAAAESTSAAVSGCVLSLRTSSGRNADSAVLVGAAPVTTLRHGQPLVVVENDVTLTLVATFVRRSMTRSSHTRGCGSRWQRAATIGLSAVLRAGCKVVQRLQLSASAHLHMHS